MSKFEVYLWFKNDSHFFFLRKPWGSYSHDSGNSKAQVLKEPMKRVRAREVKLGSNLFKGIIAKQVWDIHVVRATEVQANKVSLYF